MSNPFGRSFSHSSYPEPKLIHMDLTIAQSVIKESCALVLTANKSGLAGVDATKACAGLRARCVNAQLYPPPHFRRLWRALSGPRVRSLAPNDELPPVSGGIASVFVISPRNFDIGNNNIRQQHTTVGLPVAAASDCPRNDRRRPRVNPQLAEACRRIRSAAIALGSKHRDYQRESWAPRPVRVKPVPSNPALMQL
ncbi:hypothetical protein PHYPSEUDO_014828 [Phytophthora pseudosyringae]|uniref:Uncharacterized protein n=1 Tax=Phytophthora pseudosyringae TaxID=221518 RepID=A0A8T1V6N6_9STRA|nr:hypothetical protein PHYPSEUDO_014828 [Phytophthora pseudosyringae]